MRLVRIGQRRTRHLAAESQMVQLASDRMQTRLDVAQTFSIGELCESHGQILIPAGKPAQAVVSVVAIDATAKLPIRQERDQLRENGAANIHAPLSSSDSIPPAQLA